jgi:hypothetical protein
MKALNHQLTCILAGAVAAKARTVTAKNARLKKNVRRFLFLTALKSEAQLK